MPMVKVPYPKHLISFADQISLLKQRGLSFKDEAKALHLLQNISYYRLSGYWYPLLVDKQNHIFKPGSTFETAYAIYKFDSELRKLIIAELEKIEIAVRTQIAYILSSQYDGYWFTDTSLFPIQCVVLKSWQRLMKSTSVVMKSLLRHLSLNIPTVFLQAG